jgi:hypothetical protein
MPRGGSRKGSGRKPGYLTQRTQRVAEKVLGEGLTPLEVMLRVMRELWEVGTKDAHLQAAKVAKDCAPYVHPALASVKHSGGLSVRRANEMSDDELAALAAGSGGHVDPAPLDPQVLN